MSRGRSGLPARQRGQALVFIGITTVIVLLGVILLFNVAQLTTQKMKLQNTADAAAYSGVLLEARDYNFSAYANRAMIANQVTVAQLVGVVSWLRNLDNVYRSGTFTAIPQTFASLSALGAMWTTVWNGIRAVVGGANTLADLAGWAIKGLNVWIDLLYGGSTAYHIAMVLTVPQVVLDVIDKNDTNAALSLSLTQGAFGAKHLYDAYNFTSDFNPQDTSGANMDSSTGATGSQDRQANVVFNSQDGWYNFRSYPWPLPILIDPTKFIPGNFGTAFMIMYHSGGTEMKETVAGKKFSTWTALDATGTFVLLMLWIFVPFPIPIPIPLPLPQGHGAAYCGQGSGSSLLSPGTNNHNHNFAEAYGSAFVNPLTIAAAGIQVGRGPGANIDSRCGLKRYWDVTRRTTDDPNLEGPDLLIEVEKELKYITISTSTAMTIGKDDTGQLWMPAAAQDDKLRSMSKAHTYFSRPPKLFPRDDGKTEFGSLYNPYWQARLRSNSLLEQGVSLVSAALPWP